MLLHKVYHRFSLLPFLSSKLSSSASTHSSGFSRFHLRKSTATMKSNTTSSRFLGLVPVSASAAAEDGGGDPNGSLSSPPSRDEDSSLEGGYRLPPPEIKDIVDAPPLPALSFSPHRDKIIFLKRRALPPLTDLARPEEKLAGIRIDGSCNTRSRMSFYTGIGIHLLTSDGTLGPEKAVYGFPDGSKINFVSWYSPEIQSHPEISGPYWILLWNCFDKDMLPFLNMHLFLTESFNKAKQNWTYRRGICSHPI